MSILSAALARVKPSPTIAITMKASEMKAAGRDIISLSAGEPDFDTPVHIREAAKQAIDDGKTRYTAVDGIAELKAAIAAKFRRRTGSTMHRAGHRQHRRETGHLQCSHGHAEPRRRGHHPRAVLGELSRHGRSRRRHADIVPAPMQTGYKMTPDQLEAAITPRTKWLIFNSPSNPTGAGYGWDELKGLTDVLMRHPHVWVLTDDMYEHIAFDGFTFCTPVEVEPGLANAHSP